MKATLMHYYIAIQKYKIIWLWMARFAFTDGFLTTLSSHKDIIHFRPIVTPLWALIAETPCCTI